MWLLKKLSDGSTKYLISENKTYTIGRKNCDIVLDEDASISRKHCTIHIAKSNECSFRVSTLTGVWVVDQESKYGTYLKRGQEWIKLNPNQNKELTNGSIIRFGLMEHIWSLEFKPIIACTSGIQAMQKKKLETSLSSIDGCIKSLWCKECSLVIVNEITLTIKVVLALINGVPIVTPNYVEKVVESVKNQSALPAHEDYRPAIKESILDVSLVSLDVKKNRKELFKGKKFVFPTKRQLETLKEVIVSAGGTTELYSSACDLYDLADENTIVMQLPLNSDSVTQESTKSFKEVTSLLKSKYERRVIPESEIAQAIAYSSIEKYCNPASVCFNLKRSEIQVNPGVSLIEETPPITRTVIPEPHVIPSSETVNSQSVPASASQSNEKLESQKCNESRKRIHSQNQLEEELSAKKARNERNSKDKDSQPLQSALTVESKKSDAVNSGTSIFNKGVPNMALITSYFAKQSKLITENANRELQRQRSEFWNDDKVIDDCPKRKFPWEKDDTNENSGSKRAKLPKVNKEKQSSSDFAIETPREVVQIVDSESRNSAKSFSYEKANNAEEDNDFADYFGKEKMDSSSGCIDQLNKTIFSLTLISSAYLKEDGSLIDPPSVPVNVKKFKKQKIHSGMTVAPSSENEADLSDGDWLEPHPQGLDISVNDREDW